VTGVFNSRDFGTPANRPVLTLTAAEVPEPAGVGIVALTTIAMLKRRQRRRR
jgi:hypothetical protein